MYNPISTYRIQFHKGFTFSDFEKLIPYVAKLGIKTIYASPVFEAVPGSMHGYDITCPLQINPEIGTLQQLRSISRKLKKLGIGWLQDIVPNHMAFHPNNKWLMDVLENGRESEFAMFFDILWDSPVHQERLMVPFLGKPLDEVIAARELKIIDSDKPVLDYFGQQYPLNASSYIGAAAEREHWINEVNADTNLLKQVLDKQHYELCFWKETDKQINFRRFFTVNGLICLNVQEPGVFDRYHTLIKKLVREGIFQGLRVDHIDGLYDPGTYLTRLRELAGDDTYIIVEKILEPGEQFPVDWPVQGNTGYDFLSALNNLFTCRESKSIFSTFYRSIDPGHAPLREQVYQKKRLILDQNMQGELDNLSRLFSNLKLADENETGDIDPGEFKKAITELLVYCPVYRFYGNTMPLSGPDAKALENLLKLIPKKGPLPGSILEEFGNCLLIKPKYEDDDYRRRALYFYKRLMQFTGPLMAKGVEDTLMYSYNRFIDHNEVGDSPGSFGLQFKAFDKAMKNRQNLWPLSMNASSTHDTKRGEDVRARLNVLSDLAEEWIGRVEKWRQGNAVFKTGDAPDVNDEYFIYQTIIGACPMPGQRQDDFEKRLTEYLVKALREAKRNSNWAKPNIAYERAAQKFAAAVLQQERSSEGSDDFLQRVVDYGIINSLAQTLVKYTAPGVPDLYQGCELWDLSLVDPDNRRPVDYTARERFLHDRKTWVQLWESRYDGRIKQALIAKLLQIRGNDAKAFDQGEYLPLKIKGKYRDNLLAYARHFNGRWYLTVLPLHLAKIAGPGADMANLDWGDSRILLPDSAPLSWKNMLTGKRGYDQKSIHARDLFEELPLAMVQMEPSKNGRNAGLLLHITSLPSPFAIGDIGPEAYKFVDFLVQSRQHYWQMLPVNPIDGGSGYSPYSATSAMAGNIFLLSPELLAKDGLLTADELEAHFAKTARVDFTQAIKTKNLLFDLAYTRFLKTTDKHAFADFKLTEAWWLDDFALYQYLKEKFNGRPWYEWPRKYRFRHVAALQEIGSEIPIDKFKWLQFVFTCQWSQLKKYCDANNIALLGDLPFYMSHDSVDVWSNPGLFKIKKNGGIKGIAGVPPDYFSETGQLWGMPVYNWNKLKSTDYTWWLSRLRRNLQFFDRIRLDHFRAFSEYWEVPGGSKNAINGQWQPGPGAEFFHKLKDELGDLPFVAEDLGEIDDKVYDLRDAFELPGMHVLQFAFGESMPVSEHIPHNYTPNSFAYTGTHDNNTIRGWYEKDIGRRTQQRVKQYAGTKVNGKTVNKLAIKLCYASAAKTVIVPMQDILGLDEKARMNVPSSPDANWDWQMDASALQEKVRKYLKNLVIAYNR